MVSVTEQNDEITPSVKGFRAAGVACGLKKNGRKDFVLIVSDIPCAAAGVFTKNRVKAAPVLLDMQRLQTHAGQIRAVAVNTGSANACTGETGLKDAEMTAAWVADALGCDPLHVLVLSTGVIGMHLPMENIKRGIMLAREALGERWPEAAEAIMTTDTRPKLVSQTVREFNGSTYQITGIAKGAGMIAPNMATMLSVIVTDLALSPELAHEALQSAVEQSFNRIVVDGDMSTNDTVLLLANGASGHRASMRDDLSEFQMVLNQVCRDLAKQIVRDGEGATKFITLQIAGAPDDTAAQQIANTIATSPLVKTAFFGGDANWGRIIAAAGRAGVPVEPERMRLWVMAGEKLGQWAYASVPRDTPRYLAPPMQSPPAALLLFEAGMPANYSEADAAEIMRAGSICVLLDCGMGIGWAEVWTCDLSHEYVSINGDYRS